MWNAWQNCEQALWLLVALISWLSVHNLPCTWNEISHSANKHNAAALRIFAFDAWSFFLLFSMEKQRGRGLIHTMPRVPMAASSSVLQPCGCLATITACCRLLQPAFRAIDPYPLSECHQVEAYNSPPRNQGISEITPQIPSNSLNF